MADTANPSIEAVIRSPLGEIRVWLDVATETDAGADPTAHAVRTSVRIDYADDAAALAVHDQLARVAASLDAAVRRLAPQGFVAGEASPVVRWIADRAESAPGARTLATDLFRDFVLWCDANGVRPTTQTAFSNALTDRGYRRAGKNAAGLIYRGGLRLKAHPVAVIARQEAA